MCKEHSIIIRVNFLFSGIGKTGKFCLCLFMCILQILNFILQIFGVMLVMAFKKVHPIIIICISAVVGIIFGYARWL